MFFNDAAREALGCLVDAMNEIAEAVQKTDCEPFVTSSDLDDIHKLMRQEEQECKRTFGTEFTNLYMELSVQGESPEEFYQRYEESHEYFEEWLNRPDELMELDLDEFEDWKKTEDYGMTDDELGSDDDDW